MSIGLRIQQARRRRGLSLREFAEQLNTVSHTTLGKYERGASSPNSQALIRIARALNYPLDYFLRPSTVGEIVPAFRKHEALGAKAEGQVIEEIRDWLERYLEIERIRGEAVAFRYPARFPRRVASFEEVEQAARDLRIAWEVGLDPIDDLTGHLEDKGVRVGVVTAPDGFDACAFVADVGGAVPVIVTNAQGPGDRQRLNLAHELGHLMLEVVEDPATRFDLERACHRFAGAFLAPTDTLRDDFGGQRQHLSVVELMMLKQKYGLSMAGLIHRAHDLGVIRDAEKKRLYEAFEQRGWKRRRGDNEGAIPEEPGARIPVEQPRRFRRLVVQALADEFIGGRRAAELYTEGPLYTEEERRAEHELQGA